LLDLLLTIFLSAVLLLAFKAFERMGVKPLGGVVVNYAACVACGAVVHGSWPVGLASVEQNWFWPAMILGALFFSLFNLIGWCVRQAGVAPTSTAQKLSMVIPVIAAVLLYNERLGAWKIAGILLAAPAVYLAARPAKSAVGDRPKSRAAWAALALPVVLVGSGIADAMVKWTEVNFLPTAAQQGPYLVHLFFAAAVLGVATLLVRRQRLGWKELVGGVALGIPNYFSIFFLIRLLRQKDFLQSSAAIPVVNIGVVLVSTVLAAIFFRERLTRPRVAGLALAVVALLLIALSDLHG